MLNNEEADWVRLTLQSSGWQRVMMPRIAQRGKEALRLLVLFPGERPQGAIDDNKLRAVISEAEWLLTSFENEVKMNLEERRREELLRQENEANPHAPNEPPAANP